jgi:hypothetical protein
MKSITPAALVAAAIGDFGNFMVASTPGGIETQERSGQIEQSFKETLPVDMGEHRTQFEALGFVFGESEGIFIEAKFPKGWRKKPTEHSMWTDIVDDQGRKRGGIFYKAAFYDCRSAAHLETRFSVRDNYGNQERVVSVVDVSGKVEKKITGLLAPDWDDHAEGLRRVEKCEQARRELTAWLDENYPEWRSPLAYWEE